MWDYDKLFAEGNIVGIKNCYKNKIFQISIDDTTTTTAWLNILKNNNLCRKDQNVNVDGVVYKTDFEIQYIIRLDEHGNVVEKLFDREKDMRSETKPMPELETGMFVRVYNIYKKESILGLIYDNRVIYQDGEWDEIYDLTEDEIMEVYSHKALCFNSCQEPYLLWYNPKYLTQSN